MRIVKGNILKFAYNGDLDVLVHGCNCFNTMGAGLAKSIKNKYPKAHAEDLTTIKGDKNKLGNYTAVIEQNKYHNTFIIINGYTQYYYGNKFGTPVNYNAISQLFKKIKINYPGLRITYPKIGCGLAGGDWNIISDIIDTELQGETHFCIDKNV